MKKIILALILLSTFLIANELKTVYSYQNALHIAKKENKLVLFMTSIQGCPVCGYMKDVVFEKEEIINYLNEHYVMVIKDAEKQNYPDRFFTHDMPTFYFVDPKTEEEVREPKSGGSTAEKFLSVLRIAVEGENNETIFKKDKAPAVDVKAIFKGHEGFKNPLKETKENANNDMQIEKKMKQKIKEEMETKI